jgi:Mg2+ and Co2+ transporter CorA
MSYDNIQKDFLTMESQLNSLRLVIKKFGTSFQQLGKSLNKGEKKMETNDIIERLEGLILNLMEYLSKNVKH